MWVFCLHVCLHYMRAWCLQRPEGVRCPVIGITEVVVYCVTARNPTQVYC